VQQEGYSGSLRRPVLLAVILLFLTVVVRQNSVRTWNCLMSACNHSLPDLPDLVLSLRK
jgi:hypothetical protein